MTIAAKMFCPLSESQLTTAVKMFLFFSSAGRGQVISIIIQNIGNFYKQRMHTEKIILLCTSCVHLEQKKQLV